MNPPVLVTVGLAVLAAEVGLFAAVGLLWWLAVNAGLLALVWILLLAWRRRSKGGLLDRLLRAATGRGAPGGGTSGGSGGSRKPGGRNGRADPGSGGGRGGLLDRLFPGRRPGGGKTGGRAASGGPSGGKTAGGGLWPFGKSTKPGGGPGGGSKSSKASGKKRGDDVLGRAAKDLVAGLRGDYDKPKTDKKKPAAKAAGKAAESEEVEEKPVKGGKGGGVAEPEASPQPKHQNTEEGAQAPREDTTMVQHQEDVSLHRWGRNLKTVAPAIEDLAKQAEANDRLTDAIASGVQKLANQGDEDLPASPALVAEAQAIAAELKALREDNPAGKLRALAARAESLGVAYARQHEMDEARLSGERGSRAKEKRADVAAAEQDT